MRAWLLVLGGCLAPYRAGTLAHPVGDCLDVEALIGARSEAVGPVLVIRLGNRCDHSAVVDLASLRVVARDAHGIAVELTAFDPRAEIRPHRIDAFGGGEEWIEYAPAGPYAELEVDIGRVAGQAAAPAWVRIQ